MAIGPCVTDAISCRLLRWSARVSLLLKTRQRHTVRSWETGVKVNVLTVDTVMLGDVLGMLNIRATMSSSRCVDAIPLVHESTEPQHHKCVAKVAGTRTSCTWHARSVPACVCHARSVPACGCHARSVPACVHHARYVPTCMCGCNSTSA